MEDTLSDSRGSFLKTSVKPFCLEKTSMMKADSLMSERVIWSGMVKPALGTSQSNNEYGDHGCLTQPPEAEGTQTRASLRGMY